MDGSWYSTIELAVRCERACLRQMTYYTQIYIFRLGCLCKQHLEVIGVHQGSQVDVVMEGTIG